MLFNVSKCEKLLADLTAVDTFDAKIEITYSRLKIAKQNLGNKSIKTGMCSRNLLNLHKICGLIRGFSGLRLRISISALKYYLLP